MEFTPMIILAQKGSTIYPNTNLPITLWLKMDDQKIIYMQNNYEKYTTGNDLIPITIDKENPSLLEDVKLKVKEKDFQKVINFIKEKYEALINRVEGIEMDYSIMEYTYINRFKPTVIDGFFVNGINKKDYPSLPVNLYLYCDNINYDDERDLYTLLMQNSHQKSRGFENYVTVSIDKENPQLVYGVELGISLEEFKKVQEFIKRHYDFLINYTKSHDMDIGDIFNYLDNFEEQPAKIGTTKDGYYIFFNTEEYKKIPHFHYVDEETKGEKFNTTIEIANPKYFKHPLNKMDKLSASQKQKLQEFLESPFESKKFNGTHYDYLKMSWDNNYKTNLEETTIPNYNQLK